MENITNLNDALFNARNGLIGIIQTGEKSFRFVTYHTLEGAFVDITHMVCEAMPYSLNKWDTFRGMTVRRWTGDITGPVVWDRVTAELSKVMDVHSLDIQAEMAW